jgi:hypothetical protein
LRTSGSTKTGGSGGVGQVTVTYTQETYKSNILSVNSGSDEWCPGETRNVTVTIQNTGTATWTDAGPDINIGIKWNTNGVNWTDYHIRTDAGTVAPGDIQVYIIPVTASDNEGLGYTTALAPGNNNLTVDIVYEGISWFGDNNGGVGPGNTAFTTAAITQKYSNGSDASSQIRFAITKHSLTGSATGADSWEWSGGRHQLYKSSHCECFICSGAIYTYGNQ